MTKEELAAQIDGCEYGQEWSMFDGRSAKAYGLVVVFGGGDDMMCLGGAICDEVGCYDGGTAWVDRGGVLNRDQIDDDDDAIAEYVQRKKTARKIEALWDPGDGYSWQYRTDIPHATFEVVEDGEPYCRGIVFALADLEAAP